MESKFITLEEKVLISAVIKSDKTPYEDTPGHRYEFFMHGPPGSFHGKKYSDLVCDKDLDIYSGEFVLVAGNIEETKYDNVHYLHINEVVGEKRFVIKEDDIVRVVDSAIKTDAPNATYFNWVTVTLNDWNIDLKVPTLAFGQALGPFEEAVAKITKVVTPDERGNGMGYMLYGQIVPPDTPLKPIHL